MHTFEDFIKFLCTNLLLFNNHALQGDNCLVSVH